MKPSDTDIKVNHSTYLNCSTDYGPTVIFWFHGKNHVYTGGAIFEPYHERFEIDRDAWNGTYIYNLVIHSVQPGDAGEYICAEDEGMGERYSVQLVVLGEHQYFLMCLEPQSLGERGSKPMKVNLKFFSSAIRSIYKKMDYHAKMSVNISASGSCCLT